MTEFMDQKPFIVAELSGNHNHALDRALALVDSAAAAGAHAVKLQTYTPDTLTLDSDKPEFVLQAGPWAGQRLYDLYAVGSLPWDWHAPLFDRAREKGVKIFSAPFDFSAVDFLETLDCPAYKIASPEVIDLPLIRHAASTGKPIIISTGMATLAEIDAAVDAAKTGGAGKVTLLHCISAYPTPAAKMRLGNVSALQARYPGVSIGLSDHSMGNAIALAAIALGAELVEKHFTLARADGGIDSEFSMEPAELETLVREAADVYQSTQSAQFGPGEAESASLQFRRSLYVVADMRAGDIFTRENLRSVRPALGLSPALMDQVLGKPALKDIPLHTPLDTTMVAL
ncbi:MAG: pseudaminic acid synthase [Magnetospiraceae bacterium]